MLEGGKLRPGQGLSRVQTKAWGDGHAVLSDVNNRGASYRASVLQLSVYVYARRVKHRQCRHPDSYGWSNIEMPQFVVGSAWREIILAKPQKTSKTKQAIDLCGLTPKAPSR